jgi:16S rRNA (cytosine967-C5)-methyltransferase
VWLLKKLKKQYGLAVLNNLLQTKKSSFKHIRVNLTQISVSEFVQKLNSHQINYQTSPLKNALFVDYASVLKHPEWASLYTVQSLGSMLIVDAMNIKDKTKVLDVCAAPGGKTCYIAEKNPNGTVLAFDLYEHRVELIKKYANRLNLTNITAKKSDATQLDESLQEQFDAVLCDAPCSGIGMVQKKPDILLFRTEKSITTLQKLQLSILKTASHYVKQGGTLLYSTCTLLKEENIQVIRAFLQQNQQFCLKPVQIEGLDSIKEDNTVTLLPNNEGQEGYFIARLEKNEKNIIR